MGVLIFMIALGVLYFFQKVLSPYFYGLALELILKPKPYGYKRYEDMPHEVLRRSQTSMMDHLIGIYELENMKGKTIH